MVTDTTTEAQDLLDATRQFIAPANVRHLGKLDVVPKNDRARRILKTFSSTSD